MSRFWCALWLCAASVSFAQAQDGKRVALVIGNDAYKVRPLTNAVNDARAMEKALKGAGFRVILRENADRNTMEQAAAEFFGQIGPNDTALFFYAGHGVQIAEENVLIPVDFESARTIVEAKLKSFRLNLVFEYLKQYRAAASIVIIDACRSNPVANAHSLQAGLAQPQAAGKETFVAYSTDPNNVASDSPDAQNSYFTEALAEAIGLPNLTIDDVFTRVKRRVASATGGSQTPWTTSSMTSRFFFHPPSDKEAESDITLAEKWLLDAQKQEQFGNWPEAIDRLNQILKRKPGGAVEEAAAARLPYLTARHEAQTKLDAGAFQQAAAALDKAIDLEPFAVDAAFDAAGSALLVEDLPRAVKALELVRQRGASPAVTRAEAMLKELGQVEPQAQAALKRGVPQPPPATEVFRTHHFGVPDWAAGRRFAGAGAAVDYVAVARQLPPPQPVPNYGVPAQPASVVAAEPGANAPADPAAPAPITLEDLHVEVKSLSATRDLMTEEFGEIEFRSGRQQMPVLVDGKAVTRSLPYTLKIPPGKYEIKTIEAGKTLVERQVEVKSGAKVELILK